jgi:hypothetical protein
LKRERGKKFKEGKEKKRERRQGKKRGRYSL